MKSEVQPMHPFDIGQVVWLAYNATGAETQWEILLSIPQSNRSILKHVVQMIYTHVVYPAVKSFL